jgi:hypothetical protein
LSGTLVPEKQEEKGVPGFPDFPAFWTGEEGGARTNKKLRTFKKAHMKRKKRERKMRRILRREVSSIPHKGNTGSKFDPLVARREQKRAGREKRMQMLELRRKRRNAMADISQGIASLKC